MARRKILLGNWKMNHTIKEAQAFCDSIDETIKLADKKNIVIGVCPAFLALNTVRRSKSYSFVVGAQDCHYKESGAYTGNVSIPMLKEVGINWCLVGHSERRTYEHETSEVCNLKIKALLENQFTVVYCVGETLDEYEQGLTHEIVHDQVVKGLKDVSLADLSRVVIAYEPVWSIGTGKNASKEIADEVCGYIRSIIKELYGEEASENISILYGGSVKPNNIHDYMTTPNVDGALVGGASLKAESFKELVENF